MQGPADGGAGEVGVEGREVHARDFLEIRCGDAGARGEGGGCGLGREAVPGAGFLAGVAAEDPRELDCAPGLPSAQWLRHRRARTLILRRVLVRGTPLPPLAGLVDGSAPVPGLDPAIFKGKVSVVNVWASWCIPCHDEAPLLTQIGRDKRLQVIGINYKDTAENARRFLGRYGNPYGFVGVDGNGRAGIEWGVYGVPETFIVGREGTIVYKMVGPVTPDNIDTVLKVEIDKALKAGT